MRLMRETYLPAGGRYGSVVAMAPTGVAAKQIDGYTIHSVLHLPIMEKEHTEISEATKVKLADELCGLKAIVFDEFSMAECDKIVALDNSCRSVFDANLPFGGLHIVFTSMFIFI